MTDDETRIVLEEGVGPVSVVIRARGGKPVFSQLSVAKLPEVGAPLPSGAVLADMLGVAADDVLTGRFHPQVVSCGLPFSFVPLRSMAAVARCRVRLDVWEKHLAGTPGEMVMVFAMGGERPGSQIRARMFAPGISVPEDPATGSACAALGGYLAMREDAPEARLRWVVEQGFEMGRPSILEVEADKAGGAGSAVRVGGASVMVCEGAIRV